MTEQAPLELRDRVREGWRQGPGRAYPKTGATREDEMVTEYPVNREMMPRRLRIEGDLYHPRVPDGAVTVARRLSPWGNPHRIGKPCKACPDGDVHDRDEALSLYRMYLDENPDIVAAAQRVLAGKDLACWCKRHEPCHADILLRLANDVHNGQ